MTFWSNANSLLDDLETKTSLKGTIPDHKVIREELVFTKMAKRERRADPRIWDIKSVVNFCGARINITTTFQNSYGSPGIEDVQQHIRNYLVKEIENLDSSEIFFSARLHEAEDDVEEEEGNFAEHEGNLPEEPEVEDFPGGAIAICPVEARDGWGVNGASPSPADSDYW